MFNRVHPSARTKRTHTNVGIEIETRLAEFSVDPSLRELTVRVAFPEILAQKTTEENEDDRDNDDLVLWVLQDYLSCHLSMAEIGVESSKRRRINSRTNSNRASACGLRILAFSLQPRRQNAVIRPEVVCTRERADPGGSTFNEPGVEWRRREGEGGADSYTDFEERGLHHVVWAGLPKIDQCQAHNRRTDPDAERVGCNAADVLVVTSMASTTARVGKPAEAGWETGSNRSNMEKATSRKLRPAINQTGSRLELDTN
ncbi:hypothetical protein DFH08DRAFT_798786 [Mycena albidolilacea]|uniref:Uncharacterized protein n=1 Tax=Mycena albidolilacea TaxID=1033008 RepID=A0AAD7APA8_9AGAR|nr:hypothetical protein DFH08DRAFT_798786 [Mycena albidolilacea]